MKRISSNRGHRIIRLDSRLSEIGENVPTEILIIKYGETSTQKGTFVFDEESAKSVLAAYEEHGHDLSFDYEHQTLADPPVAAPAAGWFDLELRDEGLYAVNIRWTDKAKEHLEAKEYRYFSPAFTTFPDTNRVESLINVALTNVPATNGLEPLVAARAPINRTTGLKASFSEISSAVREAVENLFGWSCRVIEIYDDHLIFERDEKFYSANYTFDGQSAVITGESVEVRRTYEPIAAPTTTGGQPEEMAMKVLLKALGLDEEATDSEALAALNALLKALGLNETEDGEALKALNALLKALRMNETEEKKEEAGEKALSVGISREIVALTGKSSSSEALGVLKAWKQSSIQVTALTARVQELESQIVEREVSELVESAFKEGKITKALKPWALEMGKKDIAQLRSFIAAAPRVVALGSSVKEPGEEKEPVVKRWEDLAPIEKHRLHVENPETYEALKADFQKRRQAQ